METRLQNVFAGKAQSKKTRKLLYLKKKKETVSLSSFFSKTATKNCFVFGLGCQTRPASLTIKSQIKVTELESSRYRGLLGVRVTYS